MTDAQTIAGHHAWSHPNDCVLRRRDCISGSCGAGRGLRQGSGTKALFEWRFHLSFIQGLLFHPVVGGFPGDDHIMDVRFAKTCGRDANKLAPLHQLFSSACADVSHPTLQSTH
jgi:hypothetical protein